jgi:TonB-linked SusC/RagA family outer membrane protein
MLFFYSSDISAHDNRILEKDLQQDKLVTGSIVDQNGESIIGATIHVNGSKIGTVSDISGHFSLNAPENSILTISYVGYLTQTINVVGKSTLKVILKENSKMLNEIVVVGFGSMKKSDLTGSVASANIKDFSKGSNTNIIQSLQGTVAGLNIGQVASAGSTPSISIRGKNTISGNTSVLIVLDGIIYGGSLSSINPGDIESIDVLKDASAAAVYGAQAANGVLLITTKKGKAGQAKIDFSSSYSIQNPTKNLRPMNRSEYLAYCKETCWHDAYTEESGYTVDNPNFNLANKMPNEYMTDSSGNIVSNDYNWWDNFTRTGTILDTKFSISGGSENSSYLLSFAHTNQKNMIFNDDFKRNSIRINLETRPFKVWKVGIQTFGSFINQDGAEPYLAYLTEFNPLASPYNSDGTLADYPMEDACENPYHNTSVSDYERHNYFFANIYSDLQLPLKGLSYRINIGNTYNVNNHNYASQYANNNNGDAYKIHSESYGYTVDNILSYVNQFGKHGINATAVYGASRNKYLYTKAEANTFARMTLGYNALEQGTNQYTYSDANSNTSIYQVIRVNYKYDDRYLITGTIRRDGFSGFSENNKFGTFPSVALGWIVSEEPLFKALKARWIDYLKIRMGWGVSGNQTSSYSSLSKVSSEIGYIFGDGNTGVLRQELSKLGNNDLKWERTTGLNFGLDFNILGNRLTGNIDGYVTTTTNLLYNVQIPTITGFSSIASNVGKVRNKGIELSITSKNIISKDFEWSTTFNISTNSNKIISLTGIDSNGDGKEDDMTASNLFIGESLSSVYDYIIDGIYQVGDDIPTGFYPGNYKIRDVNGDGAITTADKTIVGKTDPAYRFGILNKFRYKNFNLSFFINSVQGGKNGYIGRTYSGLTQNDNALKHNVFVQLADLYWSTNNPNGIIARSYTDAKINAYRYEQRNFVRLQDITLSYDVPKSLLSKFKIEGINIFVNAKNLITLTNFHGWDPEYDQTYTDDNGNSCVTGSSYGSGRPVMRTFTGGINITF